MKTQDRAIRELVLANPIPADAVFEHVEMDADDYLNEIAQPSNESPYLGHVSLAPRWSRHSMAALAAFAVVLLIGAAALWTNPTQSQPTLASKDDLIGTWEFPFQKTATEMEFLSDGTYTTFKHRKIIDEGTYELTDGVLDLQSYEYCASPGSPDTQYPPNGSYLVVMEASDLVTYSVIDDPCPRYRDLDKATLQRPTN